MADEKRILTALKQATADVDDGMSPNSAIVKSARDHNIQSGMLPLLTYAYNTGRSTYQRENSNHVLDKLAAFELADVDAIRAELYPAEIKKASTHVSVEYGAKPKPFLRDKLAEEVRLRTPLEKTASAVAYDRDYASAVNRAYSAINAEKRAVEESRRVYTTARDNLLGALGTLSDYFKYANHDSVSFSDFEHNAVLLHGNPGQKVANYVCNRNTQSGRRVKRASDAKHSMKPMDRKRAPYTLLDGAIKAAEVLFEAHKDYMARTEDAMERTKEASAIYGDYEPKAPRSILLNHKEPATTKRADFWANMVGGGLGAAMTSSARNSRFFQPTDDLVEAAQNRLTDPVHEDELRAIRSRALISHLMSNDEVIGGYKPQEVMQAYNEVASLSPRASTQLAIIQPLLRKRLTMGAIEPFEAAEMANIENVIRKNTDPPPPKFMPQ